jgi:hypothetical protein
VPLVAEQTACEIHVHLCKKNKMRIQEKAACSKCCVLTDAWQYWNVIGYKKHGNMDLPVPWQRKEDVFTTCESLREPDYEDNKK